MKEIKSAKLQDFDISKSNTKDTKDTSDNSNKDNKEYNLIKKTAKELGMTYKELGEAIGLSEGHIKRLANSDEIGLQVKKTIELFMKCRELELKLQDFYTLKKILSK